MPHRLPRRREDTVESFCSVTDPPGTSTCPGPRSPFRATGLLAQLRFDFRRLPSEHRIVLHSSLRPGGRRHVGCCCVQCGDLEGHATTRVTAPRSVPASQPTPITLAKHTGRGDRSNASHHLAAARFVRGRSPPHRPAPTPSSPTTDHQAWVLPGIVSAGRGLPPHRAYKVSTLRLRAGCLSPPTSSRPEPFERRAPANRRAKHLCYLRREVP